MKKSIVMVMVFSIAISMMTGFAANADEIMPMLWTKTGRSTYYNSTVTQDGTGIKLIQNAVVQHSGLAYDVPVSLLNEVTFKFRLNQLPDAFGGGAEGANGLYISLFEKEQMYWYDVPYASTGDGFMMMLGYYGADLRVDYKDMGLTTAGAVGNLAALQAGAVAFNTTTEYTVKITPDATKGFIITVNNVEMGTSGVAPDLSLIKTRMDSGLLSSNLYLSVGINSQTTAGSSFTLTEINGTSLAKTSSTSQTNVQNWTKTGWPNSNGALSYVAGSGVKLVNNGDALAASASYNTTVDVTKGVRIKFKINKLPAQYSAETPNTGFVFSFTTKKGLFDKDDTTNKGLGGTIMPWISSPYNSLFNIVNCYMDGTAETEYKFYSDLSSWNRTSVQLLADGTEYAFDFQPDATYGFVFKLNGQVLTNGATICDYTALAAKMANATFPKDLYFTFGVRDMTQTGTSFTITEFCNKSTVPIVSLNKTESILNAQATETLTPAIAPGVITNQNITWTSSNENVATVSGTGVVTGVAYGTARITATTVEGGYTAFSDITVPTVDFLSYRISGTTISNIAPASTVTAMLSGIKNNGVTMAFTAKDGITALTGTDMVGTGTTINITGTGVNDSYTLLVYGDVDGVGGITILDLAGIKSHLLQANALTGYFLTAGDTDKNASVSISDLLAVKKHLINIASIVQ
jgi:hypothetical protein